MQFISLYLNIKYTNAQPMSTKEKLDTSVEKSEYISMHILYNAVLLIAAIFVLPYYLIIMVFTGKYRKSFIQKLGRKQAKILASLKKSSHVWIHAVSVGEVTAAAPIVATLKNKRPDIEIVFSTSTETGQEMAHNLVQGVAAFIYFPLDFPPIVHKMLTMVTPDVFIMVETELWPNFLKACKARNIKTLIVNGRISPRSYKKYRWTNYFWRKIINDLSVAAMISKTDAIRLKKIGMPQEKIQVLGNAKYDALAAQASSELREKTYRCLNAKKGDRFFVAGSTHPGEEEIVIKIYAEILVLYPDFKLIIVPRHIERASSIIELLQNYGFSDIITMTKINEGRARTNEQIIVIDVIGELFKVYSLATVVYCGGSLVPKGGQNILEPAAWGKVIFYGPSMEDFTEEKNLLEEVGCGITVKNANDFQIKILQALKNPAELEQRGARGKAVVTANMGAAARYADLIITVLG
jgi:3-deoxy-D-manno-octulosonic-acid transferase